ncbi:hypothetical protein SAMN04488527_1704 [Aliiroseovarius crassostreae]|uniref:Uncharacterized protein n=1 Tax=Aliiroseovarius crassostreae TaxID=154981 RepID=A0A0P7IV08_9RHOB|nr:hypothetical protein AKJ29_01755 [Aliiroseovarius crassostreae]SFU98526.1 hypothetical protein SAMN04488527_1704 [Aliiroseovarius crassostreae]
MNPRLCVVALALSFGSPATAEVADEINADHCAKLVAAIDLLTAVYNEADQTDRQAVLERVAAVSGSSRRGRASHGAHIALDGMVAVKDLCGATWAKDSIFVGTE